MRRATKAPVGPMSRLSLVAQKVLHRPGEPGRLAHDSDVPIHQLHECETAPGHGPQALRDGRRPLGVTFLCPDRPRVSAARMSSAIQRAKASASRSELLASRLAPCSPVDATSPQAHKTCNGAAPAPIHLDPAHVVMRGRTNRDRIADRVDACGPAERRHAREPLGSCRTERRPRIQEHPLRRPRAAAKWRAPPRRAAQARARNVGMKRSPCPLTSTAPSPRSASVASGIGSAPSRWRWGGTARTRDRAGPRRPARRARARCPTLPSGFVVLRIEPAHTAGGEHHRPAGKKWRCSSSTGPWSLAEDAGHRPVRPHVRGRVTRTLSRTAIDGVARAAADQRVQDAAPGAVPAA